MSRRESVPFFDNMPADTARYHRSLGRALTGRENPDSFATFSRADWIAWTENAKHEGLAPLLYHAQESKGWPIAVPTRERRALREEYLKAGGSNLLLFRELDRVLAALQDHNPSTSLILLKGAVLASTIYADIALRPMTDIDVLLSRECLEPVVEALRSLGYGDLAPEMTPQLSRETHFQVTLKGGARDYVIFDLHWRLVGGEGDWRSPRLDWFRTQTEAFRMQGDSRDASVRNVLQLRPSAHLLYLAAHLMLQHGDGKGRLLWLHDIHLMVTKCASELDWNALSARAREYGWSPALQRALVRAQNIFDTPLPEGFLETLSGGGVSKTRAAVENRARPVQTRATAAWNRLRSLDWPRRLRLARSVLWPTRNYLCWRYGLRSRWFWPAYYPLRWALLVLEVARTLAKRPRRLGDYHQA